MKPAFSSVADCHDGLCAASGRGRWVRWGGVAMAVLLSSVAAATAQAAPVVIQNGNELFVAANGDAMGNFFAVAGDAAQSSPGQVTEVLGGTLGGGASLQNNGSESGTHSLDIGSLWSTLDAGGVTATSSLVFGFGLNESGQIGSNSVTITDLVMTFELPGGGTQTFDLQGDPITVYNYIQGANTAEARIQVDFGAFDFMSEYSAASTEQFTIAATITNTSAGFEIFFLSSNFTATPPAAPTIPEPATVSIAGLLALATLRRPRRAV